MNKTRTSQCDALAQLSTDYYYANPDKDWSKVRKIGGQITRHVRMCPECNELGLVNQIFGAPVTVAEGESR